MKRIHQGRGIVRAFLAALVTALGLQAAVAQTYIDNGNLYQVPSVARPGLRVPMKDPVFGSTITRLTDPSMVANDASSPTLGLRHEYSRYPALSADKKRMAVLVLGGVDRGAHEVRDVASGALVWKIPRDGLDTEVSWHPTDPNLIFYRYGNQARFFRVDTGKAETIMTFPEYGAIRTREEGRPSDDWRYFAFLGSAAGNFSTADIVVADLVAKQVVARWTNVGSLPDWVGMSPSGQYVVAQFTNGWGTRLYKASDLSFVRTLHPDFTHSDFAIDGNGDEVLVYYAVSTPQVLEYGDHAGIATVRLRDGMKTFCLENKYWWSIHASGIGSRARRGWVLISTYSSPGDAQKPMSREVFWLKLDGSGACKRIAHHHSDQSSDASGKDYWAEPQATPSFDGNAVVFCSVWGDAFKRYDLFQVTGDWWAGAPGTPPPPPPPPPDLTPPAAPTGLRLK